MVVMQAFVSDVSWRRWLQLWNCLAVILMTVFPRAVHQCVSILRVSISEICQKCDHFAAFTGVSARLAKEKKS